jgi:hypothetical protein
LPIVARGREVLECRRPVALAVDGPFVEVLRGEPERDVVEHRRQSRRERLQLREV